MSWIDLAVILCLAALAAAVIRRLINNRRWKKQHPGCARGCAGCTLCPMGMPGAEDPDNQKT